MAEHTTGTWSLERNGDFWEIIADGPQRVAVLSRENSLPNGRLIASAPALRAALEVATKALIAERDVAYDSYTNAEGEYDDPDCEREVAQLDAIIDQCRIALGQQQSSGIP